MSLRVLLVVAAALLGPTAASAACNSSGIAAGCDATTPFSCPGAAACYPDVASCEAATECGGAPSTDCNASGVFATCSAGLPYSCAASTSCYASRAGCLAAEACGGPGPTWGCVTATGTVGGPAWLALGVWALGRRRHGPVRARASSQA